MDTNWRLSIWPQVSVCSRCRRASHPTGIGRRPHCSVFNSKRCPNPLQDQPSSYKTKVCRSFSRGGRCPYGARCRFVHGDVIEAQQLAMLRLMGESPPLQLQLPLLQSQPPSPHLTSTCPPSQSTTPQLGPFAQLQRPNSGPLDLTSHTGALRPSAQLLHQSAQLSQHQLVKPMQPPEDSQTCSSYASSLFSSPRYSSPQLVSLLLSQQLLSTHQTPRSTPPQTPLPVPAWQEHAGGWQESKRPWHGGHSSTVCLGQGTQPGD